MLSVKTFLLLVISSVYLIVVSFLTPGGWSPDSFGALNQVLFERPLNSVKPIWYVLIWRSLIPISFDDASAMFLFQNFIYLLAVIGLGISISRNILLSIFTVAFLLIYPAFLGVNYSNWTNSLSHGLFVMSVALLLQYTLRNGRFYIVILSIVLVIFAAAIRWESALMLWPVIMVVFFPIVVKFTSSLRTFLFSIFLLLLAALVVSVVFLELHQALTDHFTVVGRKRLPVYANSKFLVYLSAKQNVDLIPEEFKAEEIKSMPLDLRIDVYKEYHQNFRVYKICKILNCRIFDMTNSGLGQDFLSHTKNVFNENRLDLAKIRAREIAHRLINKGYSYAAYSEVRRNQAIERSCLAENHETCLDRVNINAHRRIKDYIKSAWSLGFFTLMPYLVVGIILFGISTIILVYRVKSRFKHEMLIFPYLSFVFSSYFLGLLVALSVFSGNLEFRYLVPGIFGLFVAAMAAFSTVGKDLPSEDYFFDDRQA